MAARPPAGWQPPCSRSVAAGCYALSSSLFPITLGPPRVMGRHAKVDSRVETVGVVWRYRGKPDGRRYMLGSCG
jgi:hypothetical protein